jgi:hypothetical protein
MIEPTRAMKLVDIGKNTDAARRDRVDDRRPVSGGPGPFPDRVLQGQFLAGRQGRGRPAICYGDGNRHDPRTWGHPRRGRRRPGHLSPADAATERVSGNGLYHLMCHPDGALRLCAYRGRDRRRTPRFLSGVCAKADAATFRTAFGVPLAPSNLPAMAATGLDVFSFFAIEEPPLAADSFSLSFPKPRCFLEALGVGCAKA